jgi:hypothetical protein
MHLIPAACDAPCKYYKDLFTTCPGNPGAEICAGACNVSGGGKSVGV